MTFTVPASGKDDPKNRFEFQIGDETYSVPLLGFAPIEAALLFEIGQNIEGIMACAGEEGAAAIRDLTRDQYDALEQAWIAASKVAPGESEGSTDS